MATLGVRAVTTHHCTVRHARLERVLATAGVSYRSLAVSIGTGRGFWTARGGVSQDDVVPPLHLSAAIEATSDDRRRGGEASATDSHPGVVVRTFRRA